MAWDAEEREDHHDQEEKYDHVAHLWHRAREGDADLVQGLPRLHQPQHAEHAQHAEYAEEGEIDSTPREEDGETHVDGREDHDGAVELVPPGKGWGRGEGEGKG